MQFKDYYKILGVEKTSSADEIKKAYRKLAQKYHPDRNPGDEKAESQFKEINEAYDVLGDTEKRKKYDTLGSSYTSHTRTGGSSSDFDWESYSSAGQREGFGGGGFSDFFEKIFGGGFGGQRPSGFRQAAKGEDYRVEVSISLKEAYTGTSKRFKVNNDTLDIKFKPGIADGQELRIAGKGYPGQGGAGDLILKAKILTDPGFERKGNDLYTKVKADLYTLVLGGKISVSSLSGTQASVNITAGSQPGKTLKLKGMGMPVYGQQNKFGDLYITLEAILPSHLTQQEKDLFIQLRNMKK